MQKSSDNPDGVHVVQFVKLEDCYNTHVNLERRMSHIESLNIGAILACAVTILALIYYATQIAGH